MCNSLQPHGLWPTRLFCPWDSLGKSPGVGCYTFLQGILPTPGWNQGLSIEGWFFTSWATREALEGHILWITVSGAYGDLAGSMTARTGWVFHQSKRGPWWNRARAAWIAVKRWAVWSKVPWTSGSELGRGLCFCPAPCVLFTKHSGNLELPAEVSFITPSLSEHGGLSHVPRKMTVIKIEVNVF